MTTPKFLSRIRSFLSSVFFNPYKRAAFYKAELVQDRENLKYVSNRLRAVREERDALRASCKDLRGRLLETQTSKNVLANTWMKTYERLRVQADAAEQACEEFVQERAALKDAVKLRDIAGIQLCKTAIEQEAALAAVQQDLAAYVTANEALIAERDEMAKHIPYLKSVEGALQEAGVVVADAPEGPVVTIDIPSVLKGLKAGRTLSMPQAVSA